MSKKNTPATTDHNSNPEKRLRQNLPAPHCPNCSKDGKTVVCVSKRGDPFFTRYYCPTPGCRYSQKVARPQIDQILKRQEENEGFSAR